MRKRSITRREDLVELELYSRTIMYVPEHTYGCSTPIITPFLKYPTHKCPTHLVDTDGDGEPLLQCVLDGLLSDHHHSFRGVHKYHHTVTQPIGSRQLVQEVDMTCMRQEVIRDTD